MSYSSLCPSDFLVISHPNHSLLWLNSKLIRPAFQLDGDIQEIHIGETSKLKKKSQKQPTGMLLPYYDPKNLCRCVQMLPGSSSILSEPPQVPFCYHWSIAIMELGKTQFFIELCILLRMSRELDQQKAFVVHSAISDKYRKQCLLAAGPTDSLGKDYVQLASVVSKQARQWSDNHQLHSGNRCSIFPTILNEHIFPSISLFWSCTNNRSSLVSKI